MGGDVGVDVNKCRPYILL